MGQGTAAVILQRPEGWVNTGNVCGRISGEGTTVLVLDQNIPLGGDCPITIWAKCYSFSIVRDDGLADIYGIATSLQSPNFEVR